MPLGSHLLTQSYGSGRGALNLYSHMRSMARVLGSCSWLGYLAAKQRYLFAGEGCGWHLCCGWGQSAAWSGRPEGLR